MTWVRRQRDQYGDWPHNCRTPVADGNADGDPGDLWRCDACGKLWEVAYRPSTQLREAGRWWVSTSLWNRLRYVSAGRPPRPVGGQRSAQRSTRVSKPDLTGGPITSPMIEMDSQVPPSKPVPPGKPGGSRGRNDIT